MNRIIKIPTHRTNNTKLNNINYLGSFGDLFVTTNSSESETIENDEYKYSSFFTIDSLDKNVVKVQNEFNVGGNKMEIKLHSPLDYCKYGSLVELIRVEFEKLITDFPASIRVRNKRLSRNINNILDIRYNVLENLTTFKINVSDFVNPFNVGFTASDVNKNKSLTNNFFNYSVNFNDVNYKIIDYTPSNSTINDFCTMSVSGDLFKTEGEISEEIYITPNDEKHDEFYKSRSNLGRILFNRKNGYVASFDREKYTDDGRKLFYKMVLPLPLVDKFNISINSSKFNTYLDELMEYADEFDNNYGNVISRVLIPEGIQLDFDGVEGLNKLLTIYGRSFDNTNMYIKNISYFKTYSYNNNVNTIPSELIKHRVEEIGWGDTPKDLNILNKLLINSPDIFKSKGTLNGVKMFLNILGLPPNIFDLKSYVYKVKNKLNYRTLLDFFELAGENINNYDLPVDLKGGLLKNKESIEDYLNVLPASIRSTVHTNTLVETETKIVYDINNDFDSDDINIYPVNKKGFTDTCIQYSGETVYDPLPSVLLDECGCELPISDNVINLNLKQNLQSNCVLFTDSYYTCDGGSAGATLNVNIYGGNEPYDFITGVTMSGHTFASDGEFLPTGETYAVQVVDVSGCTSEIELVQVVCYDPCVNTFIQISPQYVCELDDNGYNTGNVIISSTATGGLPPYTYNYDFTQLAQHGQTIQLIATDYNGCISEPFNLYVDCEPLDSNCDTIILDSTFETVNFEFDDSPRTSKVNLTYDVTGLGIQEEVVFVETTVTILDSDSTVLLNGVYSSFTTENGVKTYNIITPTIASTKVTASVNIKIILNNGCEYTDAYTVSTDSTNLGELLVDGIYKNTLN